MAKKKVFNYGNCFAGSLRLRLAVGLAIGFTGLFVLVSVLILGLCMIPGRPLRKAYAYKPVSPDPNVVRTDGGSGREGGAERGQSNDPLVEDSEVKIDDN